MSKQDILKDLQTAVSMELTATHQYQLHAHILEDWGLDILAAKMREEMTEELGHVDQFVERMMFLKGDPVMKFAAQPSRAQTLADMFETDLNDEKEAIAFYSEAATRAGAAGDIGTRNTFEQAVIDEEGHMAWLELQLDLVQRIGEANYIAKHMSVSGGQDGEV